MTALWCPVDRTMSVKKIKMADENVGPPTATPSVDVIHFSKTDCNVSSSSFVEFVAENGKGLIRHQRSGRQCFRCCQILEDTNESLIITNRRHGQKHQKRDLKAKHPADSFYNFKSSLSLTLSFSLSLRYLF